MRCHERNTIFKKTTFIMSHRITVLLWSLVSSFVLLATVASANSFTDYNDSDNYPFTDADLQMRVESMSGYGFDARYTKTTGQYIRYYVKHKERMEQILGLASLYNPVFERALTENNVPTIFKHLPIIESMLNPNATSRAGAAGLWQFMPATGRRYGLRQTSSVDERRQLYASSYAAAELLYKLHKKYGSWESALASYNCGEVRVNRAIKATGSTDYWVYRSKLPKETQKYVPKFIAAMYIANNYSLHGFHPIHPGLDIQSLDFVRVTGRLSLQDVATATQVPFDYIEFLNPGFKNQVIPASSIGYVIVLPQGAQYALIDQYSSITAPESTTLAIDIPDSFTQRILVGHEYVTEKQRYRIRSGDNLGSIAQREGVSVRNLQRWNKLKGTAIRAGKNLYIYRKVRKPIYKIVEAPQPDIAAYVNTPKAAVIAPSTHTVKEGETLETIGAYYGLSFVEQERLQNLYGTIQMQPGLQLNILTEPTSFDAFRP